MKKLLILLSIAGLVAVAVLPRSACSASQASGGIRGFVNKMLGREDAGQVKVAQAGAAAQPGGDEAPAQEVKHKYVVRLKNGGRIETDNYKFENGKLTLELPSGAISLDRNEVLRVEEVHGGEGGTVQKAFKAPAEPREAEPEKKSESRTVTPPAPTGQTDNNGNNEEWWRQQVGEWKVKLADAQKRYQVAEADWNKYNGLLGSAGGASSKNPSISSFQVTDYQDQRGSARVRMDKAQADINNAVNMLNVTLPDQARKAGAPPGWVR